MTRAQKFWVFGCVAVICVGCDRGLIGDPLSSTSPVKSRVSKSGSGAPPAANDVPEAPSVSPSDVPSKDDDNAPADPMDVTFTPAPAALRKLTVEQYRNTINDLLGADITVPTDLAADTAQNGFFAIGAARATISPTAAEKFENAAYAVAAQAVAPARRAAFVGCEPKGVLDDACAEQFVRRFAPRAFRRPVNDAELLPYIDLASTAAESLNDFYGGIEFAVAALLQSPNFLFRVELGAPDPKDSTRLRYTDYEMASRLSYALWNTTPDDTLMGAAARKELTTTEGLERETERFISNSRVQAALDNFHAERLGLTELASMNKDPSVYPSMDDSLRTAMRDDVLRTLRDLTFGADRDFQDAFSSPVAYVNPALAALYGVKATETQRRVELPTTTNRASLGLLGKPAFLALNAHSNQTSPTLRGKYIRERFLCQSVAAPPANVVPVLGEPDPNAPTMRDRLKAHAKDPLCGACHNMMDPLGLALENFDAVGRFRANDAGHELDVKGQLDGKPFDGPVGLAALIHDDPRSAECLVRQLYRYAGAHIETDGEMPEITALTKEFGASSHDLLALLRSLVRREAFRYAAKE